MASYSQVAKSVREQKEKHPENYCRVKDCLWRTASGPCQKHPVPPTTTPPIHELYSRLLKSIHMADLLDASGIPVADAARMEDAQWESVAKHVGHPGKASVETRTVVLGLLAGRETAVRRLQVATLKSSRQSCPLTGPHKDCVDVTYVDHGGGEVTQAYPGVEFAEDALRYRGVGKSRIKSVVRLHPPAAAEAPDAP